jgi:hypothetical protein
MSIELYDKNKSFCNKTNSFSVFLFRKTIFGWIKNYFKKSFCVIKINQNFDFTVIKHKFRDGWNII